MSGAIKSRIINLFHFTDWIMRLPDKLEEDFWQEVSQYEEKEKMRYVSSVERIGFKRGRR